MSDNPLALRNGTSAVRAALKRGNNRCSIMLVSGVVFDFVIEQVLDDGMIGRRSIAPENTAAVVYFDAVAMVEFRP